MEKKIMFELNPSFQKKIFTELVSKYGSSFEAEKIINVLAGTIRGYKSFSGKNVPKKILKDLIRLEITSEKEINKNKIREFDAYEEARKNRKKGIKAIRKKYKHLRKQVPSIKEIISYENLDFSKWMEKYLHLTNLPFRETKIEKKKNYLSIRYSNFAKEKFRKFEVKIPRNFQLDKEFIYFFGLWCGDRAGGKRFGIINKNKEIIRFTEEFLSKNFQSIEKILYMKKGIVSPCIKYDKKFEIKNSMNGWALSVHSLNGILSSFFYYLLSNIRDFLNSIGDKSPFFAGLFDAEGNVSLYNRSFRWSCKKKELIKEYSEFLNRMGLDNKYDGASIVSYKVDVFYDKILPHLKNKDKINATLFLCKGEGEPQKIYIEVLKYLKKNPFKTQKQIAKGLKKSKVYSELSILNKFDFVTYESYPYRFKITQKGQKLIGG